MTKKFETAHILVSKYTTPLQLQNMYSSFQEAPHENTKNINQWNDDEDDNPTSPL